MSVTLLLTTIAAQVGSAYFNSKRSKAQSAELAERQQRLEEKIMLQGIENSREEYAQVCALQREIEQLMQKDRLELIQQNYLNSIELDAYNVSLEHWPLFTPPYVIKGQLIDGLSGANSTDAIPLNCIMTTSMHTKFNQKIFPQLEENLALFCSKHWNSSQPNSIRFYQNAWRDNIVDLGSRIIDLYAHLDDVPTIVLSPVVRNGKITFRIYWWGISRNAKDQHNKDAMVYDPDLAITVTDELALPEEQIEQIIEELSNKLSALISYFADQYYWIFYKHSLNIPHLISDNILDISNDIKNSMITGLLKSLEYDTDLAGVADRISYIKSLQQINLDMNIDEAVCQEIDKIEKFKLVPVDALCELTELKSNEQIAKFVDKYSEEIIEEIDIIDVTSLEYGILSKFASDNMSNALIPCCFAFMQWSPNIIIGTYCNEDYEPCIYNVSNTSRFFVFVNSFAPLDETPCSSFEICIIPIINNVLKIDSMAKKETFRERFGKRLINVGKRLAEEESADNQSTTSPWIIDQSSQVDELLAISNYFINGVEQGTVPYTKCGKGHEITDLGISNVLDWLDCLSDQAVENYNQVYIVKTVYSDKNVILYSAFLAKNDTFDLSVACKHCFICSKDSAEMRELFAGKRIYVIPFEN